MVQEFTCAGCGVTKPVSEFYSAKRNRRGHEAKCKACMIRNAREWKAANRDRARANGRLTYYRHIEKYAAYREKQRQENPEGLRQYRRDWYLRNREHVLAVCKVYRELNAERKNAIDRVWRERNKERKAANDLRWRLANRQRVLGNFKRWYHGLGDARFGYGRAHSLLRKAILAGSIVRPDTCESCHASCVPQGAHYSYERGRELDVAWLCQSCHSQWDESDPKISRRARS